VPRRTATVELATALAIVFLYEVATGVAGNETALLRLGALKTRGWSAGDSWRIFTFSFLHLNTLHLTLNVASLYWLGGIVERRIGAAGMLAVFAGGAVMSGVAGMLLGPFLPTSGIAVGASGAVFGLLAAAVILVFRPRSERDRRLRSILSACLVAAAVTSFLPNVSLAGHVGGLLGGLVVVWRWITT
jgi:membrane associated rhomboid family serine protease